MGLRGTPVLTAIKELTSFPNVSAYTNYSHIIPIKIMFNKQTFMNLIAKLAKFFEYANYLKNYFVLVQEF